MRQNEFTDTNPQELDSKWDNVLRQLGGHGIKQAKSVIVAAIYQVITSPRIQLFENQSHLKCMLQLGKRLFTIERSIERQLDGSSIELK